MIIKIISVIVAITWVGYTSYLVSKYKMGTLHHIALLIFFVIAIMTGMLLWIEHE